VALSDALGLGDRAIQGHGQSQVLRPLCRLAYSGKRGDVSIVPLEKRLRQSTHSGRRKLEDQRREDAEKEAARARRMVSDCGSKAILICIKVQHQRVVVKE
jgi:hypothetical protein